MKRIIEISSVVALILTVAILGVLGWGYYKKKTVNVSNPIVTMEVENFGTIKMELYPEIAPETVSNFIKLVQNEYYNGLKFHRVVKDFMIQGGDSSGDGTGTVKFKDLYKSNDENKKYTYSNGKEAKYDSSYTITGEFLANKYKKNTLNLTEGTLAMARADYTSYSSTLTEESYNSAGSQFFIMTNNEHTNLSGYYAGFGKVIEGMDVVKAIENVECTTAKTTDEETGEEKNASEEVSSPVNEVKISSMTVETYGVDYGMPKTLEPFNYTKWLYNLYGLTYTE